MPDRVRIREVGPRDGLQNENVRLTTEDKIDWINRLADSGLSYVEITSFVSPKWVPALADARTVARGIRRKKGVTYAALVPNLQGLSEALAADVDEISVFMSATETHNRKNINKSIDETYPLLREIVKEGKAAGKTVRGYLSMVFGCPYEGKVEIQQVEKSLYKLLEMGVDELSLGDTIGVAGPQQVREMLAVVLNSIPSEKIAMHFHDTRGVASANCFASLQMGIAKLDSSCGGIGGCPYAPGASGNIATEELLYLVHSMGIQTDVDEKSVFDAALFIERKIGKPLASKVLQVERTKLKENGGSTYELGKGTKR
nr:hydroxymethylglutaryl-CoA lyase [Bacillus piscicola]